MDDARTGHALVSPWSVPVREANEAAMAE